MTRGKLGILPVFLSGVKVPHNKMVETMLKLHKDLPKAKPPHEVEALQRQIAATDRQIDTLAYELYGLNDDEIRIVGGET
jgi:hypothetical protein